VYNPVATEAPDDRITLGSFVSAAPVKTHEYGREYPFSNEDDKRELQNRYTLHKTEAKYLEIRIPRQREIRIQNEQLNEQELDRFWANLLPF
jgi:hypothetical protein